MQIKPNNIVASTSDLKTPMNKIGTGGNPEVRLIHQCLKNNNKKTLTCLNNLIGEEKTVYVSTEKNWQPIKLAGRGTTVEKRTIIIENDQALVIYLDTSNIKLPVSSNIKPIQKSKDKNSLVIKVDIQNIEERVTLKDKEGKLILDYRIIK